MNDIPIRKLETVYTETELDGERILLNVETGTFFALRETGLAIWQLIDGQRGISAIVEAMTASYEVPEKQCRSAVERFLRDLARAGIIVDGSRT